MWKKIAKHKWLVIILVISGWVRLYGLNWDQGGHLHPDERAIVMALDRIHLPQDSQEWATILTKDGSLNPKFFAYGNLPFYLIKAVGSVAGHFDESLAHYQSINLVGRVVSTIFDLGTIVAIFLIVRKFSSEKSAYFSALFYGIAVLPLQLSHFYAVDSFLNFFIWSSLHFIVRLGQHQNKKNLLVSSVLIGCAVACKVSAVILLLPLVFVLLVRLVSKPLKLVIFGIASVLVTIATFLVFEPYALFDFATFTKQLAEQQAMTKSAFVFPYTLQFVNNIPYWYQIKNIYLWGLGPILASIACVGILLIIFRQVKKPSLSIFVILLFSTTYFAVVGKFAVGFMRYMLPIYPLLCIGAGIFMGELKKRWLVVILILVSIWPLSFLSIYSQPNSRTTASSWIYGHIPPGAKIAREHWDDGLPIGGPNYYDFLELPMYEPDNDMKWQKINSVLAETDYIIIASNRLYTPLMKMTDCTKLPTDRCYLRTSDYYQKLFAEELGFSRVAEFWTLPTIPFTNLQINDFTADETFTVYDHPKIMIFKKDVL